jgi:hypothetical protein
VRSFEERKSKILIRDIIAEKHDSGNQEPRP